MPITVLDLINNIFNWIMKGGDYYFKQLTEATSSPDICFNLSAKL